MRCPDLVRPLGMLALSASIVSCGNSGEQVARQWMQQALAAQPAPGAASVPAIADTPPAVYDSRVADPFSPERIAVRMERSVGPGTPEAVFPDAPLAALSAVGYLTGEHRSPVAMVRYGSQYRGVHVGERLSEQALLVKQIGPQGLRIGADGMPDQWLPINKP